jgi:DNA (cytosine-5)-methyltransferase 1
MKELSLFSGAGGGLLGTKLLWWKTIGYVEFNEYCQKVIKQRIADGILDPAPIFGDIRKFISEGYVASYQGMVDVITAGFPCQPFSVAGKRKMDADERNMWPSTAKVIEIVKPGFVLLENVPGIRKYLPVVIRDLRRLGYVVQRPIKIGAEDIGAPHRRKRIWILAYSPRIFTRWQEQWTEWQRIGICGKSEKMADSFCSGLEKRQGQSEDNEQKFPTIKRNRCEWWNGDPSDAICVHDNDAEHGAGQIYRKCESSEICGLSRWKFKSRVGRVANGVAHRVDRLKAIGNGQVPLVVETAWKILIENL